MTFYSLPKKLNKATNSLFLIAATVLACPPSLAGDSKDDGGNYSAMHISREIEMLSAEIQSSLYSYLPYLVEQNIISEEQWALLQEAISTAPTVVEYGNLSVLITSDKGEFMVPVDAINNDDKYQIRISAITWPILDPCGKQKLLLHEYSSLADLDSSLKTQFSKQVSSLLSRCQSQQYQFDSYDDLFFRPVENYQF